MRDASRLLGIGRGLAFLWCLAALPAFSVSLTGQVAPFCSDLVSGPAGVVGEVCVSVGPDEVEVVIVPNEAYRLVESRAALAGTLEGFPLSESLVPRLGLFPHAQEHDPPVARASYRIPRAGLELSTDELLVAVHASVLDGADTEYGAWADGVRFRPQGMPATYIVVPIQE